MAETPLEPAAAAPPSAHAAPARPARLARSAGLISVATLASRVLGVVRDVTYAWLFGAGDQMDAFNVAFRMPNLVRDLFAEGAMTAAFVPTFTRYLTRQGLDQAWRLGNLVLTALVVATTMVVVLGIVFAEPLTALFASGFAEVPGKLELTVQLTRVMFPFLTLVAIAVAFMGMLNSLGHFFVPALSPAVFNVGAIIGAVILVPVMPLLGWHPIVGLALGTLLGGLGQALVQWPALRRLGFRLRPRLSLTDPGLREVMLLMVPGTVGLAAVQINQFVNTVLATGQGTGAVSWLNYAFRIIYLPIGLFGVSIATAAIPAIATMAAQDDRDGLRSTVSRGLRLMLVLNVPATLGLVVLASPIVALIFERGSFSASDTPATAAALMFYAPGLLGYSVVKIVSPTFYALKDSRTPVMVSAMSVGANVVLNLLLVRVLGYRGLALGTALSAILNGLTLLVLLRRRIGGVDERRLAASFLRIVGASLVMAVAVAMCADQIAQVFPARTFFAHALQVSVSIVLGLAVFVGAGRLFGVEELDEAFGRVASRLAGRRTTR